MNTTKLVQLAYVSYQAQNFSDEGIRELMIRARRKNQKLEVTGLLLYDRPIFLQVLEGPPESIDKITADIKLDKRHRDMDIIYLNENLAEREFARWHMRCQILGSRLPDDYKKLDNRVKDIFNTARPNGHLAHQMLIDYREMKDSFIDI